MSLDPRTRCKTVAEILLESYREDHPDSTSVCFYSIHEDLDAWKDYEGIKPFKHFKFETLSRAIRSACRNYGYKIEGNKILF